MTTETRQQFVLGVALGLIAAQRCPCCRAELVRCDYETWRRCELCRCFWKAGEFPAGRRAERVREPRCGAFAEVRT